MMLGNSVSAESVNALGGQAGAVDETDALEGSLLEGMVLKQITHPCFP